MVNKEKEPNLDDKKMLFAAWSCSNKNYFAYQAWHSSLSKLFKNLIIFDPQENIYKFGREKMNSMFLELIAREKPDYIFLWLIYDEFSLDALLKIKKVSPKTKLINFFGDDDTLFDNFSRYYVNLIDYPLASHKLYFHNYKKEGVKNVFFSCGVNTNDFKPLKLKKKYDVSFVGTPKRDRVEFLKYLIDNKINVRIYGAGWDQYPELKEHYFGKLAQEDMIKTINESRINISFTKNYMDVPSFKARVFEICACKSFILSEYFVGNLDFLKENKEIVTFKDKEELLRKVNYYLKNDKKREEIAKRAYEKTINNYSQEVEFKRIFSEILTKENKIQSKGLPELKQSVLYLNENKIFEPKHKLIKAIGNKKYISFHHKKTKKSKYKSAIQIYSLEKSKKPISLCDYTITSNYLGQLLSFQTKFAFNRLESKDLKGLIHPSQIMTTSEYFLNNLNEFREVVRNHNYKILNKENITFVSIPLINIKKSTKANSDIIEKIFIQKFEGKLRELKNKDKLFSSPYVYYLTIHSSIFNPGIAKYLLKKYQLKGKLIKN